MRCCLLAQQKGADETGHVLGLVQVDVMVVRDFYVLEPLERGGDAW